VEVEGRVELGEAEADALMRIKAVHAVALVVAVPCAVMVSSSGDQVSYVLALSLPLLAFWLAGATEAVLGSAGAGEACKEVGKVTGRWLLGSVGLSVLNLLSQS
jgi:hypothetical protein